MGTLPPTLQEKKLRNICLILEVYALPGAGRKGPE